MAVEHVVIYVRGAHRVGHGMTAGRLADGLASRLTAVMPTAFRANANAQNELFEGVNIASRSIERQAGQDNQPAIKIIEADYYDLFLEPESQPIGERVWENFVTVGANIGLARRPAARRRDPNVFDPYRQVWHAGYHTRQRTITERYDHKQDELGGVSHSDMRRPSAVSEPANRSGPSADEPVHLAGSTRLLRVYMALVAAIHLVAPLTMIGLLLWWLYEIGGAAFATNGSGAHGLLLPTIAAGIVGFTVLCAMAQVVWGTILPTAWQSAIRMLARDPACMLRYVSTYAPESPSIRERIIARVDKAYRYARLRYPDAEIHVIAHGFGAVVAYDWLFPRDSNESARTGHPGSTMRDVETFIALGLPYEMMTTFWPGYFDAGRDFSHAYLRTFCTVTLETDEAASPIPEEAAVRRAAHCCGIDSDLTEYSDEQVRGTRGRGGVRAAFGDLQHHDSYFGEEGDVISPVFDRCISALKADVKLRHP